MSTDTDVFRRKNLIVANVIGLVIIAVVVGSVAGMIWLIAA